MRPLVVFLAAVLLAASVQALALQSSGIPLPVFEKPVTFFQEGKQGLSLGPLPKGISSLSAEACIQCHKQEHAEWKLSAHARSVTEPVFAAAFKSEPRFLCRSCHSPLLEQHPLLVRSSPSAGSQPVAPAQQLEVPTEQKGVQPMANAVGGDRNPHYSESLAREGVTCVTCHVREGTVLSSRPAGRQKAPHALSYSPMLAKAEFCGGCHQFDVKNPRVHPFEVQPSTAQAFLTPQADAPTDVLLTGPPTAPVEPPPSPGVQPAAPQPAAPTAVTPVQGGRAAVRAIASRSVDVNSEDPPVPSQPSFFSQYQQEPRFQHSLDELRLLSDAGTGQSCQSCHMPSAQGRRRHNWEGRNSLAMLRQAITLTARLDRPSYREGDKLQAVIKLKNLAGHRFPTGDSLHAGILDVWLRDGKKTLGRQVFVMSNQNAPEQILTNMVLPANRSLGGGFGGSGFSGLTRLQTENMTLATGLNAIAPQSASGEGLEGLGRADTRLQPGEEAMLVYRQVISKALAQAKAPTLRVRVFHAAVHPGFRGSGIDPALSPLRLVREENLPVTVTQAEGSKTDAAAPASASVR
jgi:hypothetical protein